VLTALTSRLTNTAAMKDLLGLLKIISPVFSEIFSIGGTTGLSIGVLHQGEVIHTQHFGQRDATAADPKVPNDDTVYYIASLTKAITSAAMGILVDEKKLSWDTLVSDVLPEFRRADEVGQKANMIDILSHRTGLSMGIALWIQRSQEFMMPKNETINTCNYLEAVKPFRSGFHYNNWGYGLATEVIERVSGKSFGTYVKEAIFEPLGMDRTTIDIPDPGDENVAAAHMLHDDGSPCKVPLPPQSDTTGLAGAGGAKSTTHDLLLMYKGMLLAYTDQVKTKSTSTPNSPFKQMEEIFRDHTPIGKGESYTLGWVRTELPHSLGLIGMNSNYLDEMPVIGIGNPGKSVLHHNGNLVGMLSSVHLIPETESAVIVMSNSLPFTDPTDWVGQLIVETVFGEPNPQDYAELSRQAKAGGFKKFEDVRKSLEENKTDKPPSGDLEAYAGTYYNSIKNFKLEVTVDSSELRMTSQGFKDVVYDLLPYDRDTFYWPSNREDELCKHAMFPWTWVSVHKISFLANKAGEFDRLSWGHAFDRGPEIFTKAGYESSEVTSDIHQNPLVDVSK
jgi:CubicO group peptidase (beta-lactamase class C family)